MAQFELQIRPQVDRALAELTEDEQEEVLRLLDLLRIGAYLDGVRRHPIKIGDRTISFIEGDGVWVSYHLTNNFTVSVINCGKFRAYGSLPMM